MWIEERNGYFRMYERYTDPSGERHKVSVKFDRNTPQQRNKAKAKLDEMIEKRTQVMDVNITFETLTKFYLIQKKPLLKPSTHRRNSKECDTFNKLFGKVKVSDLSAQLVRKKLLKRSKYKPSTFNEHLERFKEIIKWGYRNDYVEDMSVLKKLTPLKDKSRKEKIADKFLEKEECQALLEAMNPSGRLLAHFMILSGLRIGEALALSIDDLKIDSRVISVHSTRDPVTLEITSTKTFASTREVYMQDDLLALCETIRDSLEGKPKISPMPLFWNEDGRPMEQNAFNKCLRETSEMVFGRKITSHVLRHTHASLMAENGVDYEVLSRRLGHENSNITKQIYIHVTERKKQKDNESIREISLV